MLADESLLPDGDLKDFSEKQRELRKTEFDVRDAIEAWGTTYFRSAYRTTSPRSEVPLMLTNPTSPSVQSEMSGLCASMAPRMVERSSDTPIEITSCPSASIASRTSNSVLRSSRCFSL